MFKYILIPQGAKVGGLLADCFYRSIQYRTFVILGKKIDYIIIHLYVIIVILLNIILGGDDAINIKWSFEI